MRDVLEGAFRTLKSCRCRQQPGVDGCYRCVYAYQRQNELELVSRELGIEMLGEILARWDHLQPVQFLSQVQLPDLLVESELEGRFLTTLEAHQKKHQRPWNKLLRSGKWCYEFQADGRQAWLLEPQVDLTASEGVPVPCRPDFVLWPQGEPAGALPVAIFTDGFAFHVKPDQPQGGLGDDIRKRLGLVRSGRFVVWSLTWDDVDEFTKDEGLPGVGLLLDLGIDRNRLRTVLTKAQSSLTEGFIGWSGLESLLRYLARPEPEQWRKAVAAALLVSMLPPAGVNQIQKYPAPGLQALAERLRSEAVVDGLELPPTEATGSHLAKLYAGQSLVALVNAPVEAANKLEAGSFAALLRIEDRQEQRQAEGFRGRWRKSLHTANLLQFLPGFEWVSAEAVEFQPTPAPTPSPSTAKPAQPDPLAELLIYCDPRCHDLLRAVVARGCAVPEIGFELQDDQGRVCARRNWPGRTSRSPWCCPNGVRRRKPSGSGVGASSTRPPPPTKYRADDSQVNHADRCHRQRVPRRLRPHPPGAAAEGAGVHGEVPHQPEGAGDQLREDPRRQGRQGPHGADRPEVPGRHPAPGRRATCTSSSGWTTTTRRWTGPANAASRSTRSPARSRSSASARPRRPSPRRRRPRSRGCSMPTPTTCCSPSACPRRCCPPSGP